MFSYYRSFARRALPNNWMPSHIRCGGQLVRLNHLRLCTILLWYNNKILLSRYCVSACSFTRVRMRVCMYVCVNSCLIAWVCVHLRIYICEKCGFALWHFVYLCVCEFVRSHFVIIYQHFLTNKFAWICFRCVVKYYNPYAPGFMWSYFCALKCFSLVTWSTFHIHLKARIFRNDKFRLTFHYFILA